MKNNFLRFLAVVLCGLSAPAFGQGTAFNYQGQLNINGAPANSNYDLTFALFTTSNGVTQVGTTLTNLDVGVTNGLFITTLDFGSGIFTGSSRWLELGVRSNGSAGAFTGLFPLQEITAAPYAILANSASNLLGTLPNGSLSGAYPGAVILSNAADSFAGNGAAVSNVNAAQLGGLPSLRFWQTTGNSSTPPTTNYPGTTDNNALELHVNGQRALRLEPGTTPNVIGGYSGNYVAPGITGTTIGGGGSSGSSNVVTKGGGTVSGGNNNSVTNTTGVVSGGANNLAGGNASSVGGGSENGAEEDHSTVGGGQANIVQAGADHSVISGGQGNTIQSNGYAATISGGNNNTNNGNVGTIGGGQLNLIVGGGYQPTVGGGYGNVASNWYSTISGGISNTNLGNAGTIAGGQQNGAGNFNQPTVGGGYNNQANNSYATVPGGYQNIASGEYSFAAGLQAEALHPGSFVWADSQGGAFASTGSNQFLIRAQHGVGINTTTPLNSAALDVEGSATGNFAKPMSLIENNSTASNASPALRVESHGNVASATLSVSSAGTGLLAQFGNANTFVAQLDTNGNWTANSFNGIGSNLTGISSLGGSDLTAISGTGLSLGTNIYLNGNPIYLHNDKNHGLAYCGDGVTNFPNTSVQPDGPVLWGYTGGALAVLDTASPILSWNSSGVTVAGTLAATNIAGSGAVPWTPEGSSVQMAPNNGYVATSGAQVTFTLPTSANPGDIVRVSGGGSGGWKVAQTSGQVIFGSFLQGVNFRNTWTGTSPPPGSWYAAASSLDETHLVAVSESAEPPQATIITSTNAGASWITNNNAPINTGWGAVASSADGSHLIVGATGSFHFGAPGALYTSADSGITWVSNSSVPLQYWASMASSYDGTHLYAGSGEGAIYISANSGSTWTASNPTNDGSWSVACSANGSNVWAADYTSGYLFHSVNAGGTWSTIANPGEGWDSICCSADGTKVLAAGIYPGEYVAPMWYSGNNGATWNVVNVGASTTNGWVSVASSASGQYLAAVAGYDNDESQIFYSTNFGSTWTAAGPTSNWKAVTVSGDGTKLMAVSSSDLIDVSQDPLQTSTSSTTGFLTGGQSTATELQYIGSSAFLQISHYGDIFAQ